MMASTVLDGITQSRHVTGSVCDDVNRGIEGPPIEGREVALTVPDEPLDLTWQIRWRLASVEHRDVVAARDAREGDGATDERRTSDEQ